jgi:hypothetical protein
MRSLSNWLLAGALLASLTWNWRLAERGPAPQCAPDSCSLDTVSVELTPEQRAELQRLCARSCDESERLTREADALQAELIASLGAEMVAPDEITRQVAAVSELRKRSLESCVQGILGIRSVLAPSEVRRLVECCERGAGRCK